MQLSRTSPLDAKAMNLIAGLGTEWNVTNERDVEKRTAWKGCKEEEREKINKIKKRTRRLWNRCGGREKEGSNIRERKEEKEKKKEEWGEARRDNMCGRGGERQHPGGVRAGESASQLSRLVKHAAQVSLWRNNYWFIIILIGTGLRGQRRGLIISPL